MCPGAQKSSCRKMCPLTGCTEASGSVHHERVLEALELAANEPMRSSKASTITSIYNKTLRALELRFSSLVV